MLTMTARGADINTPNWRFPSSRWRDEFHYVYLQISGDYTIVAKVESITNTNAQAKASLMIRDSLADDSTYAMMCITPSNSVWFQYRATAGGPSTNDSNVAGSAPYWLKLQRTRNKYGFYETTAWYSLTGAEGTWTQLGGSVNITSTEPVCIGLALTSHNAAATCTAVFSNVSGVTPPSPWTHQDIGIKSNIAAPLYVTLQDSNSPKPVSATVTHPNPYIVLQDTWQEWNIALSDFTGVNLTKVNKITIGIGPSCGRGTLYFDDIRLYLRRCVPANRRLPDFTGSDCIVDYSDLNTLTSDWLITDYNDDPLVGWYKFDDGIGIIADDSSASGNDANLAGGKPSWVAGHIGSALDFNGLSDYVEVTRLVQDDFTLAAWIKTDANGAWEGIQAWQGSGLMWSDVGGGASDFVMAVMGKKLAFGTGPGATGGDEATISNGDVVTGQWVHVAATRDRGSGQVINGALDRTTIHSNTASLTANSKIHIGGNTLDSRYCRGLIDDVRMYDKALSQAEIASIMAGGLGNVSTYHLVASPADLYKAEAQGSRAVNFRDYATFASAWLEILLWP